MIARSKKLIYDSAVALFLLVVFVGCAQTRANIKEPDAAVNGEIAVIQAINVSSDASQIEVQTDKPLSYTYYKTDDPPKVVIDLAQTDPGSVTKNLEVNAGNIKSIEVAKHDFTGGFLSRIEVLLAKGEDFTVATDSVDKGKLLIKFAVPAVDEKRVAEAKDESKSAPVVNPEVKPIAAQQQADTQTIKAEEKPAPVVEASTKPETQQIPTEIKEEKKDAQQSPTVASNVVKEEKLVTSETNKDAAQTVTPNAAPAIQAKVLRAVTANDEGIEINVTGGVDAFNAFKLTKPDRVVLDLPGVKSGMVVKSVAINKFTVSQARLGNYPDKIRIVFDASKQSLPAYQVVKSSDGLKVIFAKASVSADAANIAKEPVNEPVQPPVAEKKAAAPKTSAIEAIDFKIVDDYSQIAIKINGDCNPGKVVKVAGGLSLTINNCQVPAKFQRMIDTGAFPGVVKKITPYQVKVKKGNNARILVKLRQATSFSLKQEGNTVYWNIQNPEVAETPAAAPRTSKRATEAAVTAPAQEKVAKAGETELGQENKHNAPLIAGEYKVYTGRRVSLEFSDADIRKILQLIAEVSNLNFLIGDDVSGTISVKLVNVPWDQALDVILETKGLEKKQEGNIMYIKPKGKFKTENQEEAEAQLERERRMPLKTKVFDINFAAVGDIAGQFDKLKSERGTIAQDARTNRVIVTDVEDRLKKMSALLKELDMPEKQVMIEARIVQASNTFSRDIGVQWGLHYTDNGGNGSFLGITSTDVGLGGIVTPAPLVGGLLGAGGSAAGITFGKLANDIQLDLKLSAAATLEQIKIISTPKILTLNNKAGKITQGQNIPYSTVSAEGTKTEFVEASLTLEVTPHIAADGSVSMKIKATNNSPGSSGSPPPINTQEATTEVMVNNGETIVIGGIYADSDTASDQGVPYLQNIPVLGWLFKSNKKLKKKTELLIFITPKIVN